MLLQLLLQWTTVFTFHISDDSPTKSSSSSHAAMVVCCGNWISRLTSVFKVLRASYPITGQRTGDSRSDRSMKPGYTNKVK